jgi:tetratricopeptide (TPR) repeat protein
VRKLFLILIPVMLLSALGCSRGVVVVQTGTEVTPATIKMRNPETNFNASIEHLRQAKIFYARDKYKQALQHCEKAVSFDSRNWEAYYYMGLCMQKRKDFARALETFRTGLRYVPDNRLVKAEMHFALGYCFENMGRLEEARSEYETSLTYNPNNDSARKGSNRVKVEKTLKKWGKEKDIRHEG